MSTENGSARGANLPAPVVGEQYPAQAYAPPPPASDLGATLRRHLGALRRYRWVILGLFLLGTIGGVVGSRFTTEKYVAQATIWIEATGGPNRAGGTARQGLLDESRAWIELLRSYIVLDWVVIDRQLYLETGKPEDRPYFADLTIADRFRAGRYRLAVSENGQTFTLRSREGTAVQEGRVGDPIGAQLGFRWQPAAGHLPPGRTLDFEVLVPRQVSVRLNGRIATRTNDAQGKFLRIEYTEDTPSGAAGTLTSIVTRYVDVAGELNRAKLTEQTELLSEQLVHAEQELRNTTLALEGFRVQTITLPTDQSSPVSPGIAETRGPVFNHFFQLKFEADQLIQDRDAIGRALADPAVRTEALEIIPSVRNSSTLMTALQELNEKRAQLRALLLRYFEEHQVVQRLRDEVQTLEQSTVPALARTLQQELDRRAAEVARQVDAAGTDMRQIPPRMLEEARLRRELALAESHYISLQASYAQSRMAANSTVPDVAVLDPPREPQKPLTGSTQLSIILMGLAAGLGAGIGVALLLDRVDSKVRYPEQITSGLGLPILAGLPQIETGRNGRSGESMHQVVEAFRSLRFNVQQAYGSAGPIVFTVTSPGSGDGKSFVSSNLAVAFADLGLRTLLVDGDIRRGKLHHLLGTQRTPGLTDLLLGAVELPDVLQPTSYPRLQFVGCGRRLAQGPELLNSVAMRQLVVEARKSYDVIILDSAPLGAGADPYVMSTLTGNMLLVLRTGETDRPLALSHLEMLDRLPIRILGAVMNAVPHTGLYRYYSYLPGYESKNEADQEPTPVRELEAAGT